MSNEKALQAARDAMRAAGIITWGPIADRHIQAAVDAYLSALVPDEVAGVEPSGYLFRLRYGPENWSRQDMFSELLPENPDDVKEVRPLYSASTLIALAARAEKAERELSGLAQVCVDGGHTLADAHIRITALEAENRDLREIVSKCCNALPNGAFCSPKASMDFMRAVPDEILLVTTRLVGEAETARAKLETVEAETLPCDVMVAPRTTITKGCSVATLMLAISKRKGWPDENTRFPGTPLTRSLKDKDQQNG